MIAVARPLRILIAAVLIAAALWLLLGRGSSTNRPYKVDAIFDVARGIGPQQVVKIAGAKVGTVTGVALTRDDKARVEMSIAHDFGPFRADASCQIEPEGVISENFVECSPGSDSSPALAADSSGTPTVQVAHTAEPVSLQDLFDIWTVPTSERLGVLLDELGIGVSGRGNDIAAVLERANPALAAAQKAIGLVNRQKDQLLELLDAADPVVSQLAAHDSSVQKFIDAGAKLTRISAGHASALSDDIAQLPALLKSAQPALVQLDELGSDTVPLLKRLRSASGQLAGVVAKLPGFSSQGVSTLTDLKAPLTKAAIALTEATPTLKLADTFATDADPAGESLDQLLVSLRDSGAFENLLRGFYNGAALTSHYDSSSHVIFADMLANQCVLYATVASSACDAHLDGSAQIPGEGNARSSATSTATTTTPATITPAAATPTATTPAIPAPTTTTTPTPSNLLGTLSSTLGSLLGGSSTTPSSPTTTTSTTSSTSGLSSLLGYLLK